MEQTTRLLAEMEGLLRQMYVLAFCAAQDNCPDIQRRGFQRTLVRLKDRYECVAVQL